MWEMIKAEFRHIRRNRLLLLSAIVICFIPFLYSIFFLKSVWDPYGNTQDLPVAVVNKDVPIDFQGQHMAVGKTMVKELKKNHQLKWEFVSPAEAKYGMAHRKYYTVVTIPKDFSKNATTVVSKHPKKMKLQYETNDSLNYIGEVISQVGVTRLNSNIRASVTRAYAMAMFKALHVVGKGMNQAADGATQLNNGLVTLHDGVNQYVAGVSLVNNGVQTLQMGVAPLASGAQQLASGSATLANGVARYTGGVGQLAGGLNTLMSNSGALSGGAGQLSSGLNTLSSNSNELRAGAGQLAAGNQALNTQMNAAFKELPTQFGQLSQPVMDDATNLKKSLDTMNKSSKAQLQALSGALERISGTLEGLKVSDTDMQALKDLQGMSTDGLNPTQAATIEKAQAAASDVASDVQNNNTQIENLQSQIATLKVQINAKNPDAQAVIDNATNLQNHLIALQNKSGAMITGLAGKLQAPLQQLDDGANKLNGGVQRYTDGVNSAAAGANTLNAGVQAYTTGVGTATAGANQLTANSAALNSGAGQLAGALGQLNGQVPALVGGINQLASGTQQLVNNSPALVQGIVQLNNGAGQLANALGKGSKQINGIKTSGKMADMVAEPSTLKHKNYSYVPNYGHALAPYVLSVALYVGALIFNFVYPIRRVAIQGKSPVAWWASKVVLGSLIITLMALAEGLIMMALGLTVIHVPSFLGTLVLFGLASMAVVMFLSMTFDNPGRFVAMVLLMLQLGGSGGTFPMEVTMKFYNVIHWYLPMTYSILGLRNGISGGLGAHYVSFCNSVLAGIAVVFFILTLLSMIWLQHHHFAGKSELDNNQELLGEEKDDDGMHLQDRDQTI